MICDLKLSYVLKKCTRMNQFSFSGYTEPSSFGSTADHAAHKYWADSRPRQVNGATSAGNWEGMVKMIRWRDTVEDHPDENSHNPLKNQ